MLFYHVHLLLEKMYNNCLKQQKMSIYMGASIVFQVLFCKMVKMILSGKVEKNNNI